MEQLDVSTHRLPEGKENHKLDTENLEERPLMRDVVLDLDIKLDQAVHSNGDSN
jgi:hypothetical protein